MTKTLIPALWELYREFCQWAVTTANAEASNAVDFLGWLERYKFNK